MKKNITVRNNCYICTIKLNDMEQIRKTIKVNLNNIIRDASIALEMRDYEELSELEQDLKEYLVTESNEVIKNIKRYVYKYVDIKDNKELYEYFVGILGV